MTLAAITTFPKTTHKINTGETSWTHTVDLFKIPYVNQRLKRTHGAPVFKTIFH